jgi:hypothetical protein
MTVYFNQNHVLKIYQDVIYRLVIRNKASFLFIFIIEIRDLQTFKGLALQDILTETHLYVHKSKLFFPPISSTTVKLILVVLVV